jgi:hypothetical protein
MCQFVASVERKLLKKNQLNILWNIEEVKELAIQFVQNAIRQKQS